MPLLDHIKLLYLPANTTSKLQPLDQGVINNFKVYYRKEVVQHEVNCIEENKSSEKALETLYKYFELSSVGDYAIFDMLYFIEKSLTENNLRQSKVTEFFQS